MEPAAQHRGELCLGGGKLGNMQRGLRQQGVDHLAGRHGMYFVFTVAVNGHVEWRPFSWLLLDGRCEKTKRTALQIRQEALNSSV
jgi:hypothetical protein